MVMKYIGILRERGLRVVTLENFLDYEEFKNKGYSEIVVSGEVVKVHIPEDFRYRFLVFLREEGSGIFNFQEHPEQLINDRTGLGDQHQNIEDF